MKAWQESIDITLTGGRTQIDYREIIMSNVETFCRQVRSRSKEHREAMRLLSEAGLAGQMMAILRQELDSLVRVFYLLAQPSARQVMLISASVNGEKWFQENSKGKVTDKEMIDLAQELHGWPGAVYKFGCAFIHLSAQHDYKDRDPLSQLPVDERDEILGYSRHYHGGPTSNTPTFLDFIPYLPKILEKVTDNLEYYLEVVEDGTSLKADEI